jgi:tetratricopeptide (TPR) repeat protein
MDIERGVERFEVVARRWRGSQRMKKALAIITYSREQYLALVLPSILAQRIGDKLVSEVYDVFIFQDGWWKGETSENRLGHATISTMLEAHPQKGRVFRQNSNLGVALHFDFIEKLLFVENAYDFVAFCEDDLILAPGYMSALDQMGDRFVDDPRVGMMSAHPGDCTVPLEVQREHRRDFAAMGHNWGFGLARSFWERRQPFVEGYLNLVRDVPYRRRDEALIFNWLKRAGFRGEASSQDYIKCCATTALGACRLSTYGNLGLPIGRTGLHCTPEKFLQLGMDRAVVVDEEPRIGPLSDEQFSHVFRKSSYQKEVSAGRAVKLEDLTADRPAEGVSKEPSDRLVVRPEPTDAMSPVLRLVSSRLTNHPQWAVPLLEVLAGQLAVPILRRARDSSNDPPTAIRAAISIAQHARADVEDWIAVSHFLATDGRLSESLSWANRVLQHQPHVASHHRLKASLLERLDQFEEALAAVSSAIELDPENPDLIVDEERMSASHVQAMRRVRDDGATKLEVAIDEGMKLAQRAQALVEDWAALALLLAKAERLNEALAWSSRALRAEPGVIANHCLKVTLLQRLVRFEEALHAADQALALHPRDAALAREQQRVELSYLKYLRQRRDGSPDLPAAIAAGQQLAQREPQMIEDWLALAQLLVRHNRDAEALIWIEKATMRKPRVAEYFTLRATVLERLGRYEEALGAATQALAIRPADFSCASERDRLGKTYRQSLRRARDTSVDMLAAIESGLKLAHLQPDAVEDWTALAQLFARAERLNEALAWVERAVGAEPAVVGYQRLRASLLERLGRYKSGYRAAKKARALDPSNSELARDAKRMFRKSIAKSLGLAGLVLRYSHE